MGSENTSGLLRMMQKDLYLILEISRDASAEEIKKSYRRLALKYHPDTQNGGDEAGERFKEISEAYSILGNQDKRRVYDLNGYGHLNGSYPGGGSAGGHTYRPRGKGSCGSFQCRGGGLGACFSSRGGGWGRAFRHPFPKYQFEKGAVHDIPLTSHEALTGTEKVIEIDNGSKTIAVKIKTQSNLQDGDFLIIKYGHPWQKGRDLYLRVRLTD
ncbi:MAG: J domain-containing protein [Deltaproteobacteria bacterium]|nr:J domain-containing protein [Deltaproteobacteria bacterium]